MTEEHVRTSERVAASSKLQPTGEREALSVVRAPALSSVHQVSVVAAMRQAEQVVRHALSGPPVGQGLAK